MTKKYFTNNPSVRKRDKNRGNKKGTASKKDMKRKKKP